MASDRTHTATANKDMMTDTPHVESAGPTHLGKVDEEHFLFKDGVCISSYGSEVSSSVTC